MMQNAIEHSDSTASTELINIPNIEVFRDREQGKYLVLPEWASPWKTKSYCRQKYYMNNESVAILCFYSVNEVMKFIGNNEREVTLTLNICLQMFHLNY